MFPESTRLAILLVAWLVYFALHSALASLTVKRWLATRHPDFMPVYRIGFNTIAVLGLLPILWLLYSHPGPVVWSWSGMSAYIANGLALAAVAGFFYTLRDYDGSEFLGLRQWFNQTRTVEDQECFHLTAAHRFVRHPWYFFSLVILWTRDMSAAMLLSALVMTAYFIVGSRMEERKLIAITANAICDTWGRSLVWYLCRGKRSARPKPLHWSAAKTEFGLTAAGHRLGMAGRSSAGTVIQPRPYQRRLSGS